jgi:hypothetical protein
MHGIFLFVILNSHVLGIKSNETEIDPAENISYFPLKM